MNMPIKNDQPLLQFSPRCHALTDSLSAAVLLGDDLWVASDESTALERLTTRDGSLFGEHRSFDLQDFIRLPARGKRKRSGKEVDQEIDIEGLDYSGGYLWLAGSHSVKRRMVEEDEIEDKAGQKNIDRLSKTDVKGNRFMLARIPLVAGGGGDAGKREPRRAAQGRGLTAAQLPCTTTGNSLTDAIAGRSRGEADPHLAPYLSLPGKDNGFDIEGLAVSGEKIFLGLRGPVLRGWAIILEIEVAAEKSSALRLKKIGPGRRPYKKHFLDLGGLGVRDLCLDGPDLLILAGPTMSLDGPVVIFRWKNGARAGGESLVRSGELTERIAVPYGQGTGHAEGMTLIPDPLAVLVVFDSPGAARRVDERTVRADVIRLR